MYIDMSKANRNDPCPCGSGLKYKKCCAQSDAARKQKRRYSSGFNPTMTGISQQKLSGMQTFANKVMKVLSSPAKVSLPAEEEVQASVADRGYGSLEELIGVEGPPQPVKTPDEKEATSN
jgi:hypothetical protein